MLYTFSAIMIVLWLMGVVTSHTMGGFIHLLVVLAAVSLLVRIIQGRKVI
jgi:hypothetical protein